ncbi:MAG: Rpn family recombination-promoting nuclease/putative transposase [Planctomycetaceae bacterium]
MALGIDPTVDFAFKLLLGSPEHPRVTIHFLNAVLDFSEPVTEVEFLNPILGRERSEDKLAILDVLARDATGRQFNIEMQTTLPTHLPRRLTYYNCLNYVRQISAGERYLRLRPALSICVLSRTLFGEFDEAHLSFRLRCDQQPLVFTNDLEFHTLELPKFRSEGRTIAQFSRLEKWLYLLKNARDADAEELVHVLDEPEYTEAVEILNMISKTPEDRQFYEARMKFLHDQEARLIAAREEGLQTGILQGREQGIEAGRQEGRQEGRNEGQRQGLIAGRIQMLQELLGDAVSSMDDLGNRSAADLSLLQDRLQERLRNRDS